VPVTFRYYTRTWKLSIEKATKIDYNPENINPNAKKSIGIDPGFGSGNFAIVATQLVDGKIQVISAEEYERDEASFSDTIHEVWKPKQRCGHVTNIYVDAANPEIWQAMKKEFSEPFDERTVREKKAYAMKYNLHIEDQMFVVPIPFIQKALRCYSMQSG
jgi:hypothetical protein